MAYATVQLTVGAMTTEITFGPVNSVESMNEFLDELADKARGRKIRIGTKSCYPSAPEHPLNMEPVPQNVGEWIEQLERDAAVANMAVDS